MEVLTLGASCVAHAGRGRGVPSFPLPQKLPEQAVELGEDLFLLPLREVSADRVPVREVVTTRFKRPFEAGSSPHGTLGSLLESCVVFGAD